MAKDVLVVKCDVDIPFDEWDFIVHYIKGQVGEDYHVIGLFKRMSIDCVTQEDKVFNIDGDIYSYQAIKKAIEATKQEKVKEDLKENSTETKQENKEAEDNKK